MPATTPQRDPRATTVPTPLAVKRDPGYWISGPGYARAQATDCPHQRRLTDTCPNCD
jgi:hypothetical protein